MSTSENRLEEYYVTGSYKGFYEKKECTLRLSSGVCLTFSNGRKGILATGLFTEQALKKIFDKIDEYHLNRPEQKQSAAVLISHTPSHS